MILGETQQRKDQGHRTQCCVAKSFAHLWVELYCHLQESSILQQRTTANLREWSPISAPNTGLSTSNLKTDWRNHNSTFSFSYSTILEHRNSKVLCQMPRRQNSLSGLSTFSSPSTYSSKALHSTGRAPSSREQQRAKWGSSFGKSKEYSNHQPSAK